MLAPNRMKFRKVRKGKIRGVATAGHYIAYGDFALQAQGHERITSRQIESAVMIRGRDMGFPLAFSK